jgi:hypothetical protein
MSVKQSTVKAVKPQPSQAEKLSTKEAQSAAVAPKEPAPVPTQQPPTQTLTLKTLYADLQALTKTISDHTQQIAQLQETLARKRRPPKSNGKIQIKDKLTGKVYPSKNNAYQSLLKSGDLKDLVSKGVFGDIPEKNTFGWYVLVREWPDRFEEVPQHEETCR